MSKNYGLVIAPSDPKAHILGSLRSLPKVIIQPDGQWDKFLPVAENQDINFEECGCTVFGTLNAIETNLKQLTGQDFNYSERFDYILAGITCPGADPHYVCEVIRMNGVIPQDSLPMTKTLSEFNKPKPMTTEFIKQGLAWPFDFKHEWVIQGELPLTQQIGKMVEALTYSPLCASVYAWEQQNGLYIRKGEDCHWVEIYGYEYGKYWKCFDSYDNSIKHLAWDFGFNYVKRFYISKKNDAEIQTNWVIDLIKRMGEFVSDILLRLHAKQS